jgi:3-oxoacyl-[acyl-carrier-protein] synthase III
MGISYIDFYLPEERVPIRELIEAEKRFDHAAAREMIHAHGRQVEGLPASQLFAIESNASIFRTYNDTDRLESDIRSRWNISHARVEKERSAVDVFRLLLDRCFTEAGLVPDDVDHLLYCSYNLNMYQMDRTCIPHALQESYGMSRCTTTLLFRDCASVMAAIEYAEGLLARDRARHCLILCANLVEKMPRLLDFTVVSDSAGIALLSKDAPLTVVDHRSLSRGSQNGSGKPNVLEIAEEGVRVIRELLAANGLTVSDLDHIVTNNTNEMVYRHVYARLLGVAPEKLLSGNTNDGGHCGNVDMIRNLKDIFEARQPGRDGPVLLYNAGGTVRYHTWNVVLLR